MNLIFSNTQRGFKLIKFKDHYETACSLQKSSLYIQDAIWLGVENVNPEILWKDALHLGIETDVREGHIPYVFPKEVQFTNRMHLTRKQVAALLPLLQVFVDTGELP